VKFEDTTAKRKRVALEGLGVSPLSRFKSQAIPPAKAYTLFDPSELSGVERTLAYDVESYPNYFEVGFKCVDSEKVVIFEASDYGYFINNTPVNQELWCQWLGWLIYRYTIVGFNSRSYDLPICVMAIKGVQPPMLNEITGEIINGSMAQFEIERKYCGTMPTVNHIDIIEVCPLQASLKAYSARLHCERTQDLPFPPQTVLEYWQMSVVKDYNINDLDNTILIYKELLPQIKLRGELGLIYDADLRSRSDAQIAETVIGSELAKFGKVPKAPEWQTGDEFYYQVPDFIEFKTEAFQHALDVVAKTPFVIGKSGYADCPKAIEKLKPSLGSSVYRLGAGGLHSSEEAVCHQADENTLLIDRDVASYYPYIILNQGLYPQHLGEPFLKVFRNIVDRRINAKRDGDKVTADSLKITINGTFGKLGNPYSKMYSPDLLIQVTMSGQLCLLMLIEMIELAGIPVVSANTDGIVIKCPKDRYDDLETIIIIWEEKTGFITEETRYSLLASRDVNNYIAIKEEGGAKTKGVYSLVGSALNSPLSKNPESYVCSLAVQRFLEFGTAVDDTIYNCREFSHFINVRNVKGGAEKDGEFLGKVVRWYYAKGQKGTINYVLSGNKVPKSDGAKPCMNMPEAFPDDIDYDRYINDANEELYKIGFLQKLTTGRLL
jgi:hypothetical protein